MVLRHSPCRVRILKVRIAAHTNIHVLSPAVVPYLEEWSPQHLGRVVPDEADVASNPSQEQFHVRLIRFSNDSWVEVSEIAGYHYFSEQEASFLFIRWEEQKLVVHVEYRLQHVHHCRCETKHAQRLKHLQSVGLLLLGKSLVQDMVIIQYLPQSNSFSE